MGSTLRIAPVAAALALFATVQAAAASAPYKITELKPLKGSASFTYDVNLSGQATGVMTEESESSFAYRGFFYDPGTGLVDIGDLGGMNTFALALNDAGAVTGFSQTPSGKAHAFIYTPGVGMRDLGAGPGQRSFATDISESGNVIGNLLPGDHAFFWSGSGGMRDLGPANMTAFNFQGDVFGYRVASSITPGMWKTPYTTFEPFGPLPSPFATGKAVDGNIFGHSTGSFIASGGGLEAAFYWDGRAYRNLTPTGIPHAIGESINDADNVIVHGTDANRADVPYLYRLPSSGPVRGDTLNPSGSPFSTLVEFTSIDDIGHIGGSGRVGGEVHGFVLTPDFRTQVDTVGLILHGGVSQTNPFWLFTDRVLQLGGVNNADATSCFELRELRRSLTVAVGVPFTQPQRQVGMSSISAILAGNGCTNALPTVPAMVPHIFARKGERVQVAASISGSKPVTILTRFPSGSRLDVVSVRETAGTRATLSAAKPKPRKLKVKKTRTKTSVKVRISNLKPGTLRFAVVARKLNRRAMPVITEVS
jgi:probable HAF family extracellular repeat protein